MCNLGQARDMHTYIYIYVIYIYDIEIDINVEVYVDVRYNLSQAPTHHRRQARMRLTYGPYDNHSGTYLAAGGSEPNLLCTALCHGPNS